MAEAAEKKSFGSIPQEYGFFKVKTSKMIDSTHARELATVWGVAPADIEIIGNDRNPGLTLLEKLEEMGIISETNIDKLTNTMEELNLHGLASKVRKEYSKTQDPVSEKTSLKHEMYPYFTRQYFDSNLPRGKELLDTLNSISKEEYETRIVNYSLEQDRRLQSSDDANETRHIAMMGKTGDGKSSTANNILGRNGFLTDQSSESTTKSSSDATCTYKDRTITVVDTPGVHDTSQDKSHIMQELVRVAFLLRGGVHCFIICMSASDTRFTQDTKEMLETVKPDDNFFNYCMLVYTKAETELNQTTLDKFLHKKRENEDNKILLESLQNRVVAVNNKSDIPAEKERNREAIMAMVDKLVAENKQQDIPELYSNKLFNLADQLHRLVATTVADNQCHPTLVNATIEAIITLSSTEELIVLNVFMKEVVSILQKSEACQKNSNQDLVFTNYGKKTIVSHLTYMKHISLIYMEIEGNVNAIKKFGQTLMSYGDEPNAAVSDEIKALMVPFIVYYFRSKFGR